MARDWTVGTAHVWRERADTDWLWYRGAGMTAPQRVPSRYARDLAAAIAAALGTPAADSEAVGLLRERMGRLVEALTAMTREPALQDGSASLLLADALAAVIVVDRPLTAAEQAYATQAASDPEVQQFLARVEGQRP